MLHIYLNLPFSELQSAINKLIKTVMDTELSLENTLKADESTSLLDTSELGLFLKYLNPVTNAVCVRFLCLVPLAKFKKASALHKAIVRVFCDPNLSIKINISMFLNYAWQYCLF